MCGYSQAEKEQDDKYVAAFDYINKDTIKAGDCVSVANQIIPLEILFLGDKLYEKNIYPTFESKKQLLEYLLKEDLNNNFSAYDSTFSYNNLNDCKYIVYFSKPRGNILLADLVENIRKESSYKKAVAFNSAIRYCFVFAENGREIKEVLKVKIDFD